MPLLHVCSLHHDNRQPSCSTKGFRMSGSMPLPPVFSTANSHPLHLPRYPLDPTTLLKLKPIDLLLRHARATDAVPFPFKQWRSFVPIVFTNPCPHTRSRVTRFRPWIINDTRPWLVSFVLAGTHLKRSVSCLLSILGSPCILLFCS